MYIICISHSAYNAAALLYIAVVKEFCFRRLDVVNVRAPLSISQRVKSCYQEQLLLWWTQPSHVYHGQPYISVAGVNALQGKYVTNNYNLL